MATNAAHRYFDIVTFAVASTTYTTLQEVTVEQDAKELLDSGDHDAYLTFAAKGVAMTRVTIAIKDPVQAKALQALAAATITFQGATQAGGTSLVVTLSGFTGFKLGGRKLYNGIWAYTVSGICIDSGGADPYTVAPAT